MVRKPAGRCSGKGKKGQEGKKGHHRCGQWPVNVGEVPSGEKEPTGSAASTRASTATSPCATSPSWPKSAATRPRPGDSGGWHSTNVQTFEPCAGTGKRASW